MPLIGRAALAPHPTRRSRPRAASCGVTPDAAHPLTQRWWRLARAGLVVVAGAALVGAAALQAKHSGEPQVVVARRAAQLHANEMLLRNPGTRFGLGGLHLGGDVDVASDALGPADETLGAPSERSETWQLPGAELAIVASDPGSGIGVLEANVDPAGPTRFGLDGGLFLGDATLGDIVAAWGEPTRTASYGSDDFVVSYDTCFDAAPVVIKLDQKDQPRGRGAPLAYAAGVTGVLIADADEPAGGPACG
jgi:hypothetical protein